MKYTLFLFLLVFLLPLSAYSPDEGNDFFATSLQMSVYPNPSSTGNFSIELNNLTRQDIIEIRVYNLIGSEMYSRTITAPQSKEKIDISLTSAPTGIYMLEISMGEQKTTRRLSYVG